MRFLSPTLPPQEEIERYFAQSREVSWFSNFGPCHELLVERLEGYIGDGVHCVPVANCTLGLMLALRGAAGRPPPDRAEVLLPSFTFAASIEAVLWAGFQPVFVDVERDSWQLAPGALVDALRSRSGKVAAVMAGSTFGTPARSTTRAEWQRACADAGAALVVDSAAGFGALRDDDTGRPAAGAGAAEVFSFHATKPFAIGEGGLVTTVDGELAARVRQLANFGLVNGVVSDQPGLNAKLSEWHAATALAVLDGYQRVLTARRAFAAQLQARLEPLGYRFQEGCARSPWQFVPALAPSPEVRDKALVIARERGIELRTYFDPPLNAMPAFNQVPAAGALSNTIWLSPRSLSLPMADREPADATAIVGCLEAAV